MGSEELVIRQEATESYTLSPEATKKAKELGFRNINDESLEWNSIEEDRETFREIFTIIDDTKEQNDQEFREATIPRLREIIKKSPLFVRLSKVKKISKAHERTNPLEHSFRVLSFLDTRVLENDHEQRRDTRLAALYHDLGKVLIAKDDEHYDHSSFSAQLFGRLAKGQDGLDIFQDRVERLQRIIRAHHFFDDLEGVFAESNFEKFEKFSELFNEHFYQDDELTLICLVLADIMSIPKYREYLGLVVKQFKTLYEDESTEIHTHLDAMYEKFQNQIEKHESKKRRRVRKLGFAVTAAMLGGAVFLWYTNRSLK